MIKGQNARKIIAEYRECRADNHGLGRALAWSVAPAPAPGREQGHFARRNFLGRRRGGINFLRHLAGARHLLFRESGLIGSGFQGGNSMVILLSY